MACRLADLALQQARTNHASRFSARIHPNFFSNNSLRSPRAQRLDIQVKQGKSSKWPNSPPRFRLLDSLNTAILSDEGAIWVRPGNAKVEPRAEDVSWPR